MTSTPTYSIKTSETADFSLADVAKISTYKWGTGYEPRAEARLLLVKNQGFALQMTAYETSPTATYKNYNDPVYKDSCLEFFARFNPDSPLYLNFEMNSAGAFLAAVREKKNEKTPIDQILGRDNLPQVIATRFEDRWTVETLFTFEMIDKLFGKCDFAPGDTIYGNFYKCGDETPIPHFGMWAEIESGNANFHRPDFFGSLRIDR